VAALGAARGAAQPEKGAVPVSLKKIKKRSWNVIDNKALPFLELGESWNVCESK
jgi:hypothetical protein